MARLMLAFSRPRDDKTGPILGPFPWVQLTYTELRVGPDGDTIAMFGPGGDWHLELVKTPWILLKEWVEISPDMKAEPWSDIVVYAEEPAT